MDKSIKFYSHNTNRLPPKPNSSFRHLKQGIHEFHKKYLLVPADKAANNIVVDCRLHYISKIWYINLRKSLEIQTSLIFLNVL